MFHSALSAPYCHQRIHGGRRHKHRKPIPIRDCWLDSDGVQSKTSGLCGTREFSGAIVFSLKNTLINMRTDDLYTVPEALPIPEDDGACDHLRGTELPSIALPSTSGSPVDLSKEGSPWLVVYCYPRTGRPDQDPPGGMDAWNAIPGARGCTPQSCAYRDHHAELSALGATVFGLSTQDTEYQKEAAARLHLPFPLLSDAQLAFARAMRLPTFTFADMELIKRLTLIVKDGRIQKVFYPIFPSDADAGLVIDWLTLNRGKSL